MKYLKTLNINKGTGLDGLTPKILKLASHIIYLPLSHIINMSFKYDTFPKILKQSRISPIFKSGDKEMLENYRPISIILVI